MPAAGHPAMTRAAVAMRPTPTIFSPKRSGARVADAMIAIAPME